MKKLSDFIKDEQGATMPEYGLMAVLIAAACVLAVTAVGASVYALFDKSATEFP